MDIDAEDPAGPFPIDNHALLARPNASPAEFQAMTPARKIYAIIDAMRVFTLGAYVSCLLDPHWIVPFAEENLPPALIDRFLQMPSSPHSRAALFSWIGVDHVFHRPIGLRPLEGEELGFVTEEQLQTLTLRSQLQNFFPQWPRRRLDDAAQIPYLPLGLSNNGQGPSILQIRQSVAFKNYMRLRMQWASMQVNEALFVYYLRPVFLSILQLQWGIGEDRWLGALYPSRWPLQYLVWTENPADNYNVQTILASGTFRWQASIGRNYLYGQHGPRAFRLTSQFPTQNQQESGNNFLNFFLLRDPAELLSIVQINDQLVTLFGSDANHRIVQMDDERPYLHELTLPAEFQRPFLLTMHYTIRLRNVNFAIRTRPSDPTTLYPWDMRNINTNAYPGDLQRRTEQIYWEAIVALLQFGYISPAFPDVRRNIPFELFPSFGQGETSLEQRRRLFDYFFANTLEPSTATLAAYSRHPMTRRSQRSRN
jgi:hypothetical protein